ncbi:MAG: hypothetical protein JNK32_09480 [Anaerolineales bacterium]|nr:hypothetical protein [Anaerolineales bacterium]
MRDEVIQLEKFRQQIEKEMYDSGSTSDFIDRGNPTPQQLKQAKDFLTSQEKKIAGLRAEFHLLLQKSERAAIQEWVELHKGILQKILSEKSTDAHSKTRLFVAGNTLKEWEKVQAGEMEFVNINWYFLKDYKEEVRNLIDKKWWQLWK